MKRSHPRAPSLSQRSKADQIRLADALRQEERGLYRTAFEQSRDPAAVLYRYAQSFGYRPPTAQAQKAAQQAQVPAAPQASPPLGTAAPARSAPAGQPTATDVVNSIQKGQQAAASLSNIGGGAPDTELTPEALANMSQEQFERVYEEIMARGDKAKLKQLFGHLVTISYQVFTWHLVPCENLF